MDRTWRHRPVPLLMAMLALFMTHSPAAPARPEQAGTMDQQQVENRLSRLRKDISDLQQQLQSSRQER